MDLGVRWALGLAALSLRRRPNHQNGSGRESLNPLGVHDMLHVRHTGEPQMPFGLVWSAILTNFQRFQDAIWVDFRLPSEEEFVNMNPLFITAKMSAYHWSLLKRTNAQMILE